MLNTASQYRDLEVTLKQGIWTTALSEKLVQLKAEAELGLSQLKKLVGIKKAVRYRFRPCRWLYKSHPRCSPRVRAGECALAFRLGLRIFRQCFFNEPSIVLFAFAKINVLRKHAHRVGSRGGHRLAYRQVFIDFTGIMCRS